MARSVLFLIPCGRLSPSGVFRVLNYLPFLKKDRVVCTVLSHKSPAIVHRQYHGAGNPPSRWTQKWLALAGRLHVWGTLVSMLATAWRYDAVFIQWVAPPRWWTWLLKRVNPKIVFDLDDSVFLFLPEESRYLTAQARVVAAGSHFLRDHCRAINPRTVFLPTSVPIDRFPPSPQKASRPERIHIGWVGGLNNRPYLSLLQEPLARLSQKYPGRIEFTIIGPFHRTDDLESLFPNTRLRFLPFIDPEKIPPHIAEFDIGVMPLFDTDLEKGKCASKALVYMAASVPAVCSRVGENKHVIQDGVNGFLASNSDEWILKLTHLIENPDLRKTLGQNGRKTVEERYATEVCYRILRNEVLDPLLGSRRKPSAGS